MNFLIKTDFYSIIDEEILNELIDYPVVADPAHPTTDEQNAIDAANAILDDAESDAISDASGYLNERYDAAVIFDQRGSERNASVVKKICDIALYNIHSRTNPKAIPDLRVKRHDDAIRWLKQVNQAQISPVGLPAPVDGSKNIILSGSKPKRDHYY